MDQGNPCQNMIICSLATIPIVRRRLKIGRRADNMEKLFLFLRHSDTTIRSVVFNNWQKLQFE